MGTYKSKGVFSPVATEATFASASPSSIVVGATSNGPGTSISTVSGSAASSRKTSTLAQFSVKKR